MTSTGPLVVWWWLNLPSYMGIISRINPGSLFLNNQDDSWHSVRNRFFWDEKSPTPQVVLSTKVVGCNNHSNWRIRSERNKRPVNMYVYIDIAYNTEDFISTVPGLSKKVPRKNRLKWIWLTDIPIQNFSGFRNINSIHDWAAWAVAKNSPQHANGVASTFHLSVSPERSRNYAPWN